MNEYWQTIQQLIKEIKMRKLATIQEIAETK
jgi:hypothetical protein